MHDHPIRRNLDAIAAFFFGGAGLVPYLGLVLQLVCAVGAAISGYATIKRLAWEAQDRAGRPTLADRERQIEVLKGELRRAITGSVPGAWELSERGRG